MGLASSDGLDFAANYIGPMLVFGFGWPLVARVARIAHAQNTTSLAHFLTSRYGKSEAVAAVVALISAGRVVPYITQGDFRDPGHRLRLCLAPRPADGGREPVACLVVTCCLAGFAMAFGTRRIDASEGGYGLMLTIAAEIGGRTDGRFLAVGSFVVSGHVRWIGRYITAGGGGSAHWRFAGG